MTRPTVRIYTDYKSPYAYVADARLRALETRFGATLEWRPYTLRIAEYLDPVDTRSAHNWRKVRYFYMDARRQANEQGLILKGPKRIYNGYFASVGMLFAQGHGFFPAWHAALFPAFFEHRVDIDDLAQMKALVDSLGGSGAAFEAYALGPGRAEHIAVVAEAEALGVFGCPTLVLDGELFFGGDRIDRVEARLRGG